MYSFCSYIFLASAVFVYFSGQLVKDFILFKQSVEDVFVEVEPILRSALDGNNVCMLAFGQTGTGKTYTMVCLSCFFESFFFDIISAGFVA